MSDDLIFGSYRRVGLFFSRQGCTEKGLGVLGGLYFIPQKSRSPRSAEGDFAKFAFLAGYIFIPQSPRSEDGLVFFKNLQKKSKKILPSGSERQRICIYAFGDQTHQFSFRKCEGRRLPWSAAFFISYTSGIRSDT